MMADFDTAAHVYDETFSDTTIGRLQRDRVWNYIEQHLTDNKPLHILELNCGTGEDALFFGQNGHDVIATDISAEMLHICNMKIKKMNLNHRISTQLLDMRNLSSANFQQPFDLVFSNFGGLNCLSPQEINTLSQDISKILKPGGHFVCVLMPTFSLIESLYFTLTLKFNSVWRRKTKSFLLVNVNGVDIKTWYYSPAFITKTISSHFQTWRIRSIGFLPSYLENSFHRYKVIGKFAHMIDRLLTKLNLSSMADHYLIDAVKKVEP